MLDRAVGNTQGMLGTIKQTNQDSADRAILARALAVRDPAEYAKQMAAGQIVGADAQNASLDLLKFAEGRQDALQQRSDILYDSNRERTLDSQQDAFSAILGAAATELKTTGNRAKANAMGEAANLDLKSREQFHTFLDRLEDDPNQSLSRLRFGIEMEDRERRRRAADLVNRARAVGNDPMKQAEIFAGERDPEVKILAEQMGLGLGENFGQSALGSRANFGVNDASSVGLKYGYEKNLGRRYGNLVELAMANGAPPPPGSDTWRVANGNRKPTMGEVYDYNAQHILPISARRGDAGGEGTTATGPGQIVNRTRAAFAKELWGDNWRNKPATLENERQLMQVIYQKQGPQAWEATKEYAAFRDPNFFKGKDYKEVEPLLFAIDGGVLPDNHLTEAIAFQDFLQVEKGNLSTGAKVYLNTKGMAGDDLATVAAKVAERVGAENPRDVEEEIRNVLSRARAKGVKISEAQVGGLILNSLEDDNGIFTWSDFNQQTNIRDSDLEDFAATADTARMEAQKYEAAEAALGKIATYAKQYQTAEQEALAALRSAKVRPESGDAAVQAFQNLQRISEAQAKFIKPQMEYIRKREAELAEKELKARAKAEKEAEQASNLAEVRAKREEANMRRLFYGAPGKI